MKDITIRSLVAEMRALEIPAATLELYTVLDTLSIHDSAQAVTIINELEIGLISTRIKLNETAAMVDVLLADNNSLLKTYNRSLVRAYGLIRTRYNALMFMINAVKYKLKYNHLQMKEMVYGSC